MTTNPVTMECRPLRGGGAEIEVTVPDEVSVSIPMGRREVLSTVASIMTVAGIRKAVFDGGQMAVLAER